MDETFETEIKTYEAKQQELVASEGKFVVIKGTEVIGIFDTYQDALKAGYARVGLEAFFVRQIAAFPQVGYFARDLASCQA